MNENETLEDNTQLEGADDFTFESDYESLSPDERRKKVMAALYEAAVSGNVQAGLQYLAMHPQTQAEPEPAAGKKKKKKVPKKTSEPRLTVKQWRFVHAYFGEAKGNGTLAAKMAGYEGNDSVLAVTAYDLLRNPKIAKYVTAMLESAALPMEQVMKRVSEIAIGSVEVFLDWDANDTPSMQLKRARDAGKLHLVKGLEFHQNGTVKRILWYDALQANRLLGQFHQTIKAPEQPPAPEVDQEEIEATEYEIARRAIMLVMKKAKELGREISVDAAREVAARKFPKAKEVPMISEASM